MSKSVWPAVFTLIFFIKTGCLTAQEEQPPNPGRSFKVSLMDAVDPYSPAYLLSFEQPFAESFSVQAEGGPIHSFDGTWVNREPMDGFKTRLEVRKYWLFTAPKDFVYIGLQGMFKKVRYGEGTDIFCRDDCNFFQRLDFTEENRVMAGHFSMGIIFFAGQHVIIDLGGFGGLRWNNRRYRGIPEDAVRRSVPFFREPGRHTFPSLGFTMKIGFAW